MNIMLFLRSLSELLYEVMSWFIFWPISLWRAIVHPVRTMHQTEAQLQLPDDEQFVETVSPPVFLILALLVAQGISTDVLGVDSIVASQRGLAALVSDNTTLLILHVVVFGLFPALLATRSVRLSGETLTRKNLRPFFFAQCCPATPFALALSLGGTASRHPDTRVQTVGQVLMSLALLYYLVVQTQWFAGRFARSIPRAFGDACLCLVSSFSSLIVAGLLFSI
ncbi:hypothetical protein [Sandaracinobacteroides hominis]|uniref:hypothetical protein n=1 Tax=Sandaracinobacteroides hominis TaxID=2780086 RepID=UPI0018F431DC|nr:hypothetical protein [Sandaracinobacteroides hominis]